MAALFVAAWFAFLFFYQVIGFLKLKPVSGWYFPIGNLYPAGIFLLVTRIRGYLNIIILEFGQNLLSNCRNLVLGRINNEVIFVRNSFLKDLFHTGNLAGNRQYRYPC
ncbi:hypothetical protein K435DRAFT_793743 [Dendrothele bispora CBS 962.96]|uniref:Uncharacterized protein n=1 Tax=Dendrothele bispora (strain CBS 962.96) TaxID=1314807 RepID=A0A4V6T5K0_DENBC|nr:hypothetical protein K435DRAFT_793743 [Dendrothele bispora CBS 962.96]